MMYFIYLSSYKPPDDGPRTEPCCGNVAIKIDLTTDKLYVF
jgi:hypothetical protein